MFRHVTQLLPAMVCSRVEGLGGSVSRTIRRISSSAALASVSLSNGVRARQQLIQHHPSE